MSGADESNPGCITNDMSNPISIIDVTSKPIAIIDLASKPDPSVKPLLTGSCIGGSDALSALVKGLEA